MRVPSWKAHGPPEGQLQIRNPLSHCTAPHWSAPSYQPLNIQTTDAQHAFELHCLARELKLGLKGGEGGIRTKTSASCWKHSKQKSAGKPRVSGRRREAWGVLDGGGRGSCGKREWRKSQGEVPERPWTSGRGSSLHLKDEDSQKRGIVTAEWEADLNGNRWYHADGFASNCRTTKDTCFFFS